ncbi:MAG: class I SAM-dependent methyltransferase [Candidatus Omnitrophica bacterium]|nr:class I SAM-dependent methyltransferase [Candidatus Omnitrophota bacterium]
MIQQCPVCNIVAKEYLYVKSRQRHIMKCTNPLCTLQFVSRIPTAAELRELYQKHYYNESERSDYCDTDPVLARQYLSSIKENIGDLAGKSMLDVGCGRGSVLTIAKEFGLSISGVEPYAAVQAHIPQALNGTIYNDLDDVIHANQGYDLITLIEVIEHIVEPWKILRRLCDIMHKNSHMYIQTPNVDSLRCVFQRSDWPNYVNPTHLYFFNEKSLLMVMRKAGINNVTRLHVPVSYPEHNIARRSIQRILQHCNLDGSLKLLGSVT